MGAQAQKSKQKTSDRCQCTNHCISRLGKIAIDSMLTRTRQQQTGKPQPTSKACTQKRNWATWRPDTKSAMVGACLTWCRTDIQSQILETAFHLWRFRRLRIRHHLEQPDVSRLFAKPTWILWTMTQHPELQSISALGRQINIEHRTL